VTTDPKLAEATSKTRLAPGKTLLIAFLRDAPRTSLTARTASTLYLQMLLLPGMLPDGTQFNWPTLRPSDFGTCSGVGFDSHIHTANV